MKTTDLISGQYYRIEYEKDFWAIFRFDDEIEDQKLLFQRVTWFIGEQRRITLANELEKQWLLACIKAGKLVEKPININYEIY